MLRQAQHERKKFNDFRLCTVHPELVEGWSGSLVSPFQLGCLYNDHTPSHVHVQKAEGEAIIYLDDSKTKPSLREVRMMGLREVKKALEIAAKEKTRLARAWRRIHGQDEDD